jgi:hypothetical protein
MTMRRVLFMLAAAACARAQVTIVSSPPSVSVVVVNSSPSPPVTLRQPEHLFTSYFIAFKGGTVRLAEQYWGEGGTLYYVTPDRERRTAPVETIDRALSEQLNNEQGMTFRLPPEERKAEVRAETVRRAPVHRASNVASRRKSCTCTLK